MQILLNQYPVTEKENINSKSSKKVVKRHQIMISIESMKRVETIALLSKLNTEHQLDIGIGENELSEIDFQKMQLIEKLKSLY